MNKIIPLSLICIISLASCSNKKNNNMMMNDFESIDGWFENSQLRKGDAHSGNYFLEVTPKEQYSLTYSKKLSDLSSKTITKVNASAWFKFSDSGYNAKLVVCVDSTIRSPPVYWNTVNAADFVTESNKWTKVSGTFNLPKNTNHNFKLIFYALNDGTTPVSVDDLSFDIE